MYKISLYLWRKAVQYLTARNAIKKARADEHIVESQPGIARPRVGSLLQERRNGKVYAAKANQAMTTEIHFKP